MNHEDKFLFEKLLIDAYAKTINKQHLSLAEIKGELFTCMRRDAQEPNQIKSNPNFSFLFPKRRRKWLCQIPFCFKKMLEEKALEIEKENSQLSSNLFSETHELKQALRLAEISVSNMEVFNKQGEVLLKKIGEINKNFSPTKET